MSAVVIMGNQAQLVHDRLLPKLRDDYVLVKPHAVALNPTDWKHIAYGRAIDGALVGCDYAGTVQEVGKSVSKKWRKGDSICGVVHGSNLVQGEDGAFAEYIVAKGDVQMRKPADLSYAKAATISLGAITVGQGLYQKCLGLNLPTDPTTTQDFVLIYGGGTSVGGLAVQFAKLYGTLIPLFPE
jgi:NADPH:quinone reductase-like Zn-dependent oxidoreductase